MSVKKVASRYAKSLLNLAVEENRLELVREDMESLQALLKQSKEFAAFMKSPVIQFNKKRSVLEKIFTGKLNDLTLKFMLILAGKQREGILSEVIFEFLDQYRKLKHVSIVKITTAVPMSESQMDALKRKLEASSIGFEHVEVTTIIDPEILGGYIVELDDNIYDASIRQKLAALKKEFKGNLYESKIYAR